MPIYYINPSTNIDNQINIIMDNMTDDIANTIQSNSSIIYENTYINMSNNIIDIVNKYLKIYNFIGAGINLLCVQIYNKFINVVYEASFFIYGSFFELTFSNWNQFYNSLIKTNPYVYLALDSTQKESLRYAIISGDFFMNESVNIDIST